MALASHPDVRNSFSAQRAHRAHALILALLCVLFGVRVAGQALQRWMPQPFLPAFEAFQGSDLPYPVLLSTQLVLLVLMVVATSRVSRGALRRATRTSRVLGWAGGIYMAGSLARIAVGLLSESPAPWFTAWIPAVFHVVLAAFVLTLAAYHAQRGAAIDEEAR